MADTGTVAYSGRYGGYYTLFAVRNEPKPVLRYPSITTRLSTYLNANYGHFKISFFQKDKRVSENNGSFLAANRVWYNGFYRQVWRILTQWLILALAGMADTCTMSYLIILFLLDRSRSGNNLN